MKKYVLASIILVFGTSLNAYGQLHALPTNRLCCNQEIPIDGELYSLNDHYSLGFRPYTQNLVLYKQSAGFTQLWSTVANQGANRCVMQSDGNFVLYNNQNPVWASNTSGNEGASLVMQDDGNLVIISTDGRQLWASNSSQPNEHPVPFSAENFLTYSQDGKYIYTDLKIGLWDYRCKWNMDLTLAYKQLNKLRNNISQVEADDGSFLFKGKLLDKNGNEITNFVRAGENPLDYSNGLISPDGQRILFINVVNFTEWILYLYDRPGKLLTTHNFKSRVIHDARFSSNSATYVAFVDDGKTKGLNIVYDKDGKELNQLQIKDPNFEKKYNNFKTGYITISPDGKFVVARNSPKDAVIWNVESSQVITLPHPSPKVQAISRDGRHVAIAGSKSDKEGSIKVWSIDGTLEKEIPFIPNPTSIEFTPDGSGIVVVFEETALWLWEKDGYKFPEGLDVNGIGANQYAIQYEKRKAEQRADRIEAWGMAFTGLVKGLAAADADFKANQAKTNAQEKQIANIEKQNAIENQKIQSQKTAPTSATRANASASNGLCNVAYRIERIEPGLHNLEQISELPAFVSDPYFTTSPPTTVETPCTPGHGLDKCYIRVFTIKKIINQYGESWDYANQKDAEVMEGYMDFFDKYGYTVKSFTMPNDAGCNVFNRK